MRVRSIVLVALVGLAHCHKTEENTSSGTTAQPASITTKNLRTVWGTGPNDVWAAGDKGTVLHFDGHAWTRMPSGTEQDLTSITGTSPTNVYITAQQGAVLHWDGKDWHQVLGETLLDGGQTTTLFHVWSTGPSDVWAVGIGTGDDGGYLRRWNGTIWETQYIPGSSSLWGVGGTGPTDVWMVGNSEKGDGYVIHGDGKHFDANGYKGPQARSVWAAKPDDVWVAPTSGPLQHWNGTAWAAAATPEGSWCRVSGSGPDDVWAVGMDGITIHFRGGAWTKVPSGTNQIIWSVWSQSPTSAWAVGNHGTILLWNGSTWTQATT
jgi:hypothetical protein